MDKTALAHALLSVAAAHYALLLLTFAIFVRWRDAFSRLHTRWVPVSRDQYHAIAYLTLALYKLCIWLFFLVPGLVLLALD